MALRLLACSALLFGCASARPTAPAPTADVAHEVAAAEDSAYTNADFVPPSPQPQRRWGGASTSNRRCPSAAQAQPIRCPPPRETNGPPLRVAIITTRAQQGVTHIGDRVLEILNDPQATAYTLPADTDPRSLIGEVDVLILASGWAQYAFGTIASHADGYRAFVEAGGGLLMFQPNPYELQNDEVTVRFLATPFTVANSYHDRCVVAVRPHPILCGLHPSELPYPADRITDYGQTWKLLARGAETGHGSLLITELGRGRAAVDADNDSSQHDVEQRQHVSHSKELLRRLLLWLAGRLRGTDTQTPAQPSD